MEAAICPGCGLEQPHDEAALYDGYYHTSPECWSVYTRVLGDEFGNAALFGQAHQLTVDAYACQHAGGRHPDKSVDLHLAGLHFVLERGFKPPAVPLYLQRLANQVASWPHFEPPGDVGTLTVGDVASAEGATEHIAASRAWAESVWAAWAAHHEAVRAFVARELDLN